MPLDISFTHLGRPASYRDRSRVPSRPWIRTGSCTIRLRWSPQAPRTGQQTSREGSWLTDQKTCHSKYMKMGRTSWSKWKPDQRLELAKASVLPRPWLSDDSEDWEISRIYILCLCPCGGNIKPSMIINSAEFRYDMT